MGEKRKPPEMPVIPSKDGVQRRNIYTRLNPRGDEETVVKHKGKPDEETLNELLGEIHDLIESISFGTSPALNAGQPNNQLVVNQPPQLVASKGDVVRANDDSLSNMTVSPLGCDAGLGFGPTSVDVPGLSRSKVSQGANPLGGRPISKYNQVSHGDGLDHNATHSESFVGTGAIAFAPGLLGSPPPSKKKKRDQGDEDKDTTTKLENRMSTRRRPIAEWAPPFKANGYAPGEHTMPEPSGKGVADRTPTQSDVGAYDTELSASGKEWPREHNDTEAMDGVDDENISNSAEGAHESTHGEANDGHQKKVGHDWPTQPKLSGQGVAEPFGGDRWSDGGVLPQGQGPGSDTWTGTEGPGLPSDGPITGTNGPQLGHVGEGREWSPNNMARLMGEEFDTQELFNNYARTASAVCVEDFQNLLDAHGAQVIIDESSLVQLMDVNAEFMFHEGRDTDGPYWVPAAIAEGENRRPFKGKKTMNEGLFDEPSGPGRSRPSAPGIGGGLGDEMGGDDLAGEIAGDLNSDHLSGMGDEMGGMGDEIGGLGDEMGGLGDEMGGLGGEMGGLGGMSQLECPGCGYTGEDAECPECGVEMMDPMAGDEMGGLGGGLDDEMGGLGGKPPAPPMPPMESRRRTIVNGPTIVASLKNFMESARNLISRNPRAKGRDLAEALNHSWSYHAGNVNARTCPTAVQETLSSLMKKYPGFNPLVENEAMEKPEGTKLGGGDGPKTNLPKQPTEMTTHGDKSLLGKSQNGKAMAKSSNDGVGGELYLSGTGRGMNGRGMSESAVAGAPGQAPGGRAVAGAAPAAPAPRPAPARPPVRRPAPAVDTPASGGVGRPQQSTATGAATQQMQENIARLASHVKRSIQERASDLRHGKYTTTFSVLVVEGGKPAFLKGKEGDKNSKGSAFGGKKAPPFGKGKEDKGSAFGGKKAPPFGKDKGGKSKDGKPEFLKKNRTPKRDSLAEALADAEEILQLHNPMDVTFEATFLGPNGQVALKQDIPLFTINPRGPMVGEGKALFRFHRNAEAFAENLVSEGVTCRVVPHNWGSAVEARTDYPTANRAFFTLAECGEGCGSMRKRQKQRV